MFYKGRPMRDGRQIFEKILVRETMRKDQRTCGGKGNCGTKRETRAFGGGANSSPLSESLHSISVKPAKGGSFLLGDV